MKDDLYEFDRSNIGEVLGSFADANPFMSSIPLDELCEEYEKLYPPSGDIFLINHAMINGLVDHFVCKELDQLSRKGLIDVSVDEDGEFVFKTTQKGRDAVKNYGEET